MIALIFAQSAAAAAGWSGVVLAALTLVGIGIKAWVDTKTIDSGESKVSAEVRKVEVRADSQRFTHEHGLAARLLDEERAERRGVEEDRDRLANENAVLANENAALSFAKLSLEGKVDRLEERVTGLETQLSQCHEGRVEDARANEEARAADMKAMATWVTECIRTGRITEAPRARSITPAHDMEAVARAVPSATKERSPT